MSVSSERARTYAARLVTRTVAVLASTALVVGAGVVAAGADPPRALTPSAPEADRRWQPALDYDTDGCYNTAAIGPDGTLNPGLKNSGALNGACRDLSDLQDTNVYSRAKCNNGWCAYLYGYYFEKDQAVVGVDCCGHRHDWEHVVVWVQGDQARHVSVSQHSGWQVEPAAEVRWQGQHPKVVYHKDGATTHCFRFASAGDEPPENHLGDWRVSGLVGWGDYPAGIREKLSSADFGAATFKLTDARFASALAGAKPAGIAFDPAA